MKIHNSSIPPTMVQMYDKVTVKEYTKILGGAIFSREVLVRADTIEEESILKIATPKIPDKIILNGKEIKF